MYKNNPAARLFDYFQKAIDIGKEPNTPTFAIWQKTFGYSSEEETLKGILILKKAVLDLSDLIDAHQDEQEKALFARCVFPIKNIFAYSNFSNSWANTRQSLSSEVMYGLPFMSLYMDKNYNEPYIEQTTYEKWINELELLEKEIASSEKDKILREMLLSAIASLLFVLRKYSIYGNEALNQEFLKSVGILSIAGKKKNIRVMKFKKIIAIIGIGLTVISNASQISGITLKQLVQDYVQENSIEKPKQIIAPNSDESGRIT